jgi:uncharacterized protein
MPSASFHIIIADKAASSEKGASGSGTAMELKAIAIGKPADDVNVIVGQAHFIKTVEDLHEALVQAVAGIKFGIAFNEASAPCLVRHSGTDDALERAATEAAAAIGAGHVFVVMLGNAFPINVLGAIRNVSEVCTVFCATANQLKVIVAEEGAARGVIGVIDGSAPRGVEGEAEQKERHALLRRFGYKK